MIFFHLVLAFQTPTDPDLDPDPYLELPLMVIMDPDLGTDPFWIGH